MMVKEWFPPWDDRSGMWTPEIRAMKRRLMESQRKANQEEWDRMIVEQNRVINAPKIVREAIPMPWVC